MRLKISALLALAISVSVWLDCRQVSGDVAELIQHYYKCKHLKHNPTDSFYRNLGLANMNLDQAMAFIRKIYTDADDCVQDYYEPSTNYFKYAYFFRNESNFEGVKAILSAFNNKFNSKNYLKTFKDSLELVKNGKKLPSIVQFLIRFDYTYKKLDFYKNLPECEQDINIEISEACEFWSSVKNRTVIFDTTTNSVDLEDKMVCDLLPIANCSHVELRRFKAMQVWSYYTSLEYTGRSLSDFLDMLTARAKNYKPLVRYGTASISHYVDLILVPYKGAYAELSLANTTIVCLDSPQLHIDCQLSEKNFVAFNFTFYLPNGVSPSVLKYNYDTSLIQDGVIVQDDSGTSVYQIVSGAFGIILYDFNSNSRINAAENILTISSPKPLLESANGVLINGFTIVE